MYEFNFRTGLPPIIASFGRRHTIRYVTCNRSSVNNKMERISSIYNLSILYYHLKTCTNTKLISLNIYFIYIHIKKEEEGERRFCCKCFECKKKKKIRRQIRVVIVN